ncbi:MAG: phage holin family protein [Candidatus Paceibacterota bacterium]
MNYVLIRMVAVLIASYVTHVGVIPLVFTVETVWVALLVAIILAVINHTIKPLIDIVTLPINFFTLGLFSFVINGLMILLAGNIVNTFITGGFEIPSLIMAVWFAMVMSVVNFFLHIFE